MLSHSHKSKRKAQQKELWWTAVGTQYSTRRSHTCLVEYSPEGLEHSFQQVTRAPCMAQHKTKLIFSFKYLTHVLGLLDHEREDSTIIKTLVAIYQYARVTHQKT
jgi:hypothetical protein